VWHRSLRRSAACNPRALKSGRRGNASARRGWARVPSVRAPARRSTAPPHRTRIPRSPPRHCAPRRCRRSRTFGEPRDRRRGASRCTPRPIRRCARYVPTASISTGRCCVDAGPSGAMAEPMLNRATCAAHDPLASRNWRRSIIESSVRAGQLASTFASNRPPQRRIKLHESLVERSLGLVTGIAGELARELGAAGRRVAVEAVESPACRIDAGALQWTSSPRFGRLHRNRCARGSISATARRTSSRTSPLRGKCTGPHRVAIGPPLQIDVVKTCGSRADRGRRLRLRIGQARRSADHHPLLKSSRPNEPAFRREAGHLIGRGPVWIAGLERERRCRRRRQPRTS